LSRTHTLAGDKREPQGERAPEILILLRADAKY